MLGKTRWMSTALVALAAAASSGCFLAVAGIVEASRDGDTTGDPMGHDYEGQNGWIGWYMNYQRPGDAMSNLFAGMTNLRCGVANQPGRLDARCHPEQRLVAMHSGQLVYRLCPPSTDRMTCRIAWEKVHNAAPQPFLGYLNEEE